MVRTVLATTTIAFLLLAPALVTGAPTSFSAQTWCRAAEVPVDMSDCRADLRGSAEFVACNGDLCSFTLSLFGGGLDLPAGRQTLETYVSADIYASFCAIESVAAQRGSLVCSQAGTVTVGVPTDCRLVLVGARATSNGVVSANAFQQLRVCKDGNLTAI